MKVRLGYVAISKTLDNITSSSMMTYSHYDKLGVDKGKEKLNRIVKSNFTDLGLILRYNIKNDITFYRLTSKLVPLSTHKDVDISIENYRQHFKVIGNFIKKHKMRINTHPDQFCVLNSVNNEVVDSSISILKEHQKMFELMDYKGLIIIHVGSGALGKENALKRFKQNFLKLDKELREQIIIENDDKTYTMVDTLNICEELNIPMVLDYHHHVCNNNGEKVEDYILRIVNTWKNNVPKMHFSSPKNKKEFRSHNDYINVDDFIDFLERIKFINCDIDIMLESKMKDEALFRLVRQLKFKTNYKFINETTFII